MDAFNMSRIKSYLPNLPKNIQLPKTLPDLPPLPKTLQNMRIGFNTPPLSSPNLPDDSDDTSYSTPTIPDPFDAAATTALDPNPLPPARKSNLDLLNDCDSFPYLHLSPATYLSHINSTYHLQVPAHHGVSLGYLHPSVAALFADLPDWTVSPASRTLTLHGSDPAARSAAVARAFSALRELDHFALLRGWRDESYAVHGPGGAELFRVERAASALLGVVTYGAHLTAYQVDGDGLRLWVPRRAADKQTYPGLLDNTVAGGLAAGETPLGCVVREAAEEAALDEGLVRRRVKAAGVVQYFHVRDARAGGETGLFQPECQYVFDLDLTGTGAVPRPGDGEVEGFELLGVDEVRERMADGEFKPNCALVLLDFFIRHGLLTAENERDYVEIASRLRRVLEFPMR